MLFFQSCTAPCWPARRARRRRSASWARWRPTPSSPNSSTSSTRRKKRTWSGSGIFLGFMGFGVGVGNGAGIPQKSVGKRRRHEPLLLSQSLFFLQNPTKNQLKCPKSHRISQTAVPGLSKCLFLVFGWVFRRNWGNRSTFKRLNPSFSSQVECSVWSHFCEGKFSFSA